jgi:hypothetical protein
MTSRPAPLRLCLVDMNNGVANQAIRCFRRIIDDFAASVAKTNPSLDLSLSYVQPRNLGEVPPGDCDLYLSSGGPGSPFDGWDDPWCTGYRKFLDSVVDDSLRQGDVGRSALLVCHSFEIAVIHFAVATMAPRAQRKFGVMPIYMTVAGMRSPLLEPFGDRLFAWEHRSWQAIGLDERRLADLGGALLATESRDEAKSKGEGLLAFRFASGVEGTQFHPEADRAGAVAWIERPEQAQAVIDAFGELTYRRMLKTLDNPDRLARTFALLIPGWLARRFNALAPARGWAPIPPPVHDAAAFLGRVG